MLDYHLQGEIRLEITSDSGESWCLQEFTKKGKQIDRDLTPYKGSVNFTASNLTVDYQIEITNFDLFGKDREGPV